MRFNPSISNKISLLLLFFSTATYCQVQEENTYYSWFDGLIGIENTNLFNGVEYLDENRTTRENHKFFKLPEFFIGTITYDGQSYSNIEMKYNIYDDKLIARLKAQDGSQYIVQLLNEKVKHFEIDNQLFVWVNGNTSEDKITNGFYERVLLNENFTLLKKHKKKKVKKLNKQNAFYEFIDTRSKHLIQKDGKFLTISSKNDLMNLFPEQKKALKEFYSNTPSIRRLNSDALILTLARKLQNDLL